MSGGSGKTSNIIFTRGSGGSDRQHSSSSLPNGVKFAGEESKDRMYEPKHTKKLVRVLTVIAYVFSVSLAAIMLSFYYVFLWNPKDIHHRNVHPTSPTPIAPPDTACPHNVGANLLEQKAQGKSTILIAFQNMIFNLLIFIDLTMISVQIYFIFVVCLMTLVNYI
jgi:hypothetical protein